ncbi:gamma-synuclein isoform X1 [Numida meleagris]|uniref:gamma-synuclein isoform X1 n=1 Tax=Numida meleagris TaxID=8996 RepID=UPI000B3DDE3B|nr:gamma-synuclein isoform X1 [Numida meleagris]
MRALSRQLALQTPEENAAARPRRCCGTQHAPLAAEVGRGELLAPRTAAAGEDREAKGSGAAAGRGRAESAGAAAGPGSGPLRAARAARRQRGVCFLCGAAPRRRRCHPLQRNAAPGAAEPKTSSVGTKTKEGVVQSVTSASDSSEMTDFLLLKSQLLRRLRSRPTWWERQW